jgi:glycosyltransferase involved in cell wall biosynthesis
MIIMAHDQTLVSIITPSYNKGQFIEETILSVQRQTYKNIEHIIIDSKSTDNTLPILEKHESGIIWISEPDDGQSDAINKGWRMAKGDIIAYLNADDTYLPNAVEVATTSASTRVLHKPRMSG